MRQSARMRPIRKGSGVWVEPFWLHPVVWAIVAALVVVLACIHRS